ncbi:hypothetical protein ES703_34569 [subsurface metagenome]
MKEKNSLIAEWLGYEIQGLSPNEVSIKNPFGEPFSIFWKPDKDRNQQKLIEDKLIEMGCFITYTFDDHEEKWRICIYEEDYDVMEIDKSKDIAFIDAVIELIKQNENKGN